MSYNVRNENYSNYSNDQLENRSRQEHLRTQRHINTGHGIREQACNGVHRLWIYIQAYVASSLLVGLLSGGAYFGTLIAVKSIGGSCNGMRYQQWVWSNPVNWDDDQIKTWNSKCSGAMPSTPGNGSTYWFWIAVVLWALCHRECERELLREAGFKK